MRVSAKSWAALAATVSALALGGCATSGRTGHTLPAADLAAAGGLADHAAGDRARLVRVDRATGNQRQYDLRSASLLRRGDIHANVRLEPGDVIIIPESMF